MRNFAPSNPRSFHVTQLVKSAQNSDELVRILKEAVSLDKYNVAAAAGKLSELRRREGQGQQLTSAAGIVEASLLKGLHSMDGRGLANALYGLAVAGHQLPLSFFVAITPRVGELLSDMEAGHAALLAWVLSTYRVN